MKPVVYTAIPKYLVYGNLTIGKYVEDRGFAVNTPWQYTYGMAGNVDYEMLKESLNEIVTRCDELWVFAEKSGFVPELEYEDHFGLGITDGVCREINIAEDRDMKVRYFYFDAEEMDIESVDSTVAPSIKQESRDW